MGLQVLIDDQSEIPQGFEDYYKEHDAGGYVLDVEGVDSHPDVANLRNAYQAEKDKRQKVAQERDKLKPKAEMVPDDVEQETLQQVIERLRQGEDLLSSSNKDAPDPAKIKEQVEQQWRQEVEKWQQEAQTRDQQLRQMVTDQALTQALQKNKITNPAYQKAAKKLLSDHIEVAEDESGNPQPKVDTDMGPLSVEQYVQQWTAGEEGAAFLDGNSGSGARGSGPTGGRGRKEITRDQYEQMTAADAAEFFRNGGRITS